MSRHDAWCLRQQGQFVEKIGENTFQCQFYKKYARFGLAEKHLIDSCKKKRTRPAAATSGAINNVVDGPGQSSCGAESDLGEGGQRKAGCGSCGRCVASAKFRG